MGSSREGSILQPSPFCLAVRIERVQQDIIRVTPFDRGHCALFGLYRAQPLFMQNALETILRDVPDMYQKGYRKGRQILREGERQRCCK